MAAPKLIPRLDDGSKSYYKRVESFLDGEEHEGEGDHQLFLENVVKQIISDDARRVCCDKDGSRAVERLLQHQATDLATVQKLVEVLSVHCCELAVDRCGSHVMEALLKAASTKLSTTMAAPAARMLNDGSSIDDKDHEKDLHSLQECLLSICAALRDRVHDFVVQPYASHVLSSLVQVLAGVYLTDHASRSRSSKEFRKAKMAEDSTHRGVLRVDRVVQTPGVFLKQLDSVVKRICKLENFSDLMTHQCACPVLQCMLRVLTQQIPDRAKKLIKKIIKCSMVFRERDEKASVDDFELPAVFVDSIGSHLIECVIEVATPELRQHIVDSCFRGRVMTFALHPVANYPLQHLISSATPEQVSSLIDELSSLEEILFAGHTGVVVKLTEAAAESCPEKQPALLESLLKAFHTEHDPKHCAPVFLSLMTHEMVFGSDNKPKDGPTLNDISLHGSLLVQALLKFQVPKMVVNSLLKMPSDDIISTLSCDPSGSHVITTFLTSPIISLKKKTKLIKILEGSLVVLCKDKHGSRVVDVLWRQSEVQRKQELAEQLIAHEDELFANYYGKIILRNCNILHYKKKQTAWQDVERATERRRELFQDIIEDQATVRVKGTKVNKRSREGGLDGTDFSAAAKVRRVH